MEGQSLKEDINTYLSMFSITLSITISTFHNAWHGLTSLENIGLNNVWLLLPTLCQFLFLKNLILSNHQHFTSPWLLLKLKSLINFTSFINFENLGNNNSQWQNIKSKAKSNQIKSVSRHAKRVKQPSIAHIHIAPVFGSPVTYQAASHNKRPSWSELGNNLYG